MQEEKPNIDQNALSRQLAVYGHEAQGKLMAMRVFLYGVTGVIHLFIQLGVEVAKNLILAGPKHVTLFDKAIVSAADIGRNFYCQESDIGKSTRAAACLNKLKELNPNVVVEESHNDDIASMYRFD
jgi:ubiquitin-activating enzyme E1